MVAFDRTALGRIFRLREQPGRPGTVTPTRTPLPVNLFPTAVPHVVRPRILGVCARCTWSARPAELVIIVVYAKRSALHPFDRAWAKDQLLFLSPMAAGCAPAQVKRQLDDESDARPRRVLMTSCPQHWPEPAYLRETTRHLSDELVGYQSAP
eukprot:scaffold228751_cov31-Tisochrysis_lutea.AAC.3